MAIEYLTGDIFKVRADAIVIPVNTVGVMGKGLAKAAAEKHRQLETYYKVACKAGRVRIGTTLIWQQTLPWIICVPTKTHWKNPSTTGYVSMACSALLACADEHDLDLVAVPWLGCGEGGLSKDVVRPILEQILGAHPRTHYLVIGKEDN